MVHLLLAVIYLAFVSLGLPDSLLGTAWPEMYLQFDVPVSYAGAVSLIISAGTVFSSLQSDRLTRRLGARRLTALSVAMTAAALFGFSCSSSFWMLCLWAIPYGLGAGSVDAALNNYVALHYASRHMSWLHCMWGLGASAGPYIMSYALSGGGTWNLGYQIIGVIQCALTAVLLLSLPLWRGDTGKAQEGDAGAASSLTLRQIWRLPGAREVMASFFCYCAMESTAILWGSSYLVLHHGLSAETAAVYAGLFYVGITAGRALSGFVTMRLNDDQMIRLGQGIVLVGLVTLFLPLGPVGGAAGLGLVGLGCAPIYPCIIHSTPAHFGAERSQAMIGVEMASAYVGTSLMPPLFGLLAGRLGAGLLPGYLLVILVLMIVLYGRLTARAVPKQDAA